MSTHAGYFGDPDRAVFGWLEVPDSGQCRGGVVLCSTFAMEEMSAHPAYRMLSGELSRRGLAVVRFDYPGTGDSFGDSFDLDLLGAWDAAIAAAIELLRHGGAPQIAVVGMRLGATVAARFCSHEDDIEALVLWDPCVSGRSFLREQQALRTLSIGADLEARRSGSPEDLELLGVVVPAATSSTLRSLEIASLPGPLANQVLAIERTERPLPEAVATRLTNESATVVAMSGQGEFVDVLPDQAVMPEATLAVIARWLDSAISAPSASFEATLRPEARAEIGTSSILERPVRFGSNDLFGVVTEPVHPIDAPAVIFLNAGLLRHVGPGRSWVSASRELARRGIRSLRFDLGGIGDSNEHAGSPRQVSYPPHALSDIKDAVELIGPDAREVILGGLCAGAYHAIEAGLALGIRAACAINPILSFEAPAGDAIERDVIRRVAAPYGPLICYLRRFARVREAGERFIPAMVWAALDALGLQKAPGRALVELIDANVQVLLLCGAVEAIPFRKRSPRQMRRLAHTDAFRFLEIDGADHALLGANARARALKAVVEFVESVISVDARAPQRSDVLADVA